MIKEIEVGGVRHSIQAENTIKVTWAELKALRDEAKLNAGTFYRITDYVTTTTQEETKSANHPFDVIVLALSENTLCEDAKAALHEGDTYFADSDLSAWELKYCLDNDQTRFEWADETNGKGVIYRMIDEKLNDCPYDFKNILFYNTKITSYTTEDNYYYTFSYVVSGKLYDGTVEKQVKGNCFVNSMGTRIYSNKSRLLFNVFHNTNFGTYCDNNTFGNNCTNNTFGNNCTNNTFENNCNNNTFGNNCTNNTFGTYCNNNTFGAYCNSNNFGTYCNSNNFGTYCNNNTFGADCNSNTFGADCNSNTFGTYCKNNTFGDNCTNNTFGDNLQNRSLGSDKTSITLNEEFYDDGSGQLVPTKHPDLSTQPNILPYKFMGQYVYEQILPYKNNKTYTFEEIGTDKPIIIRADAFGVNGYAPSMAEVISNGILFYPRQLPSGEFNILYYKIVYTSMPEEGDYYGYNEY